MNPGRSLLPASCHTRFTALGAVHSAPLLGDSRTPVVLAWFSPPREVLIRMPATIPTKITCPEANSGFKQICGISELCHGRRQNEHSRAVGCRRKAWSSSLKLANVQRRQTSASLFDSWWIVGTVQNFCKWRCNSRRKGHTQWNVPRVSKYSSSHSAECSHLSHFGRCCGTPNGLWHEVVNSPLLQVLEFANVSFQEFQFQSRKQLKVT